MSENKDTSNVNETINAVAALAKEVPVYQDALQPSAKQIGKSLETVTKTVNIALAPIKALVWGYDKIEEFISQSVSKKLEKVPEENIQTPPPQVAGPAVEALRFSGHDVSLRELYANLIVTAMDKDTAHRAHPAFVEIIKNIISDEAIILQCFIHESDFPIIDINVADIKDGNGGYITELSNYCNFNNECVLQKPELIPSYIDNLCRLGILEIPSGLQLLTPGIYDSIESDVKIIDCLKVFENDENRKATIMRKMIQLTTFGRQFIEDVVCSRD